MRKRFLGILLVVLLLLSTTIIEGTSSRNIGQITVMLNGKILSFDQPPIIENGRTLVPLRAIFEALGADVDWNQSEQTVTAKKDDIKITLKIGCDILVKNGEEIKLDVPAKIIGGRTLIPVRAVSEAFNAEVGWNQQTRTVIIRTIIDYIEQIISYLGCECEIVNNTKDISAIMKKYEDLFILGKTEGFIPLIIVPNRILYESMESNIDLSYRDKQGYVNDIVEKSKEINATKYLNSRIEEAKMLFEGWETYNEVDEFSGNEFDYGFLSTIDYGIEPLNKVVIAKIPTNKPWELAAWTPMGGWNECPSPEIQVAVFKYWYEKYGAIPVAVHGDTWELFVEKPPSTYDNAVKLVWEHVAFCSDAAEDINFEANWLINNNIWFFWWD